MSDKINDDSIFTDPGFAEGAIVFPKLYRYDEEVNQRKHWTKKILDIENGTILGRTSHQWILLVLFYVCFYVVLMMLWAFCFWVFFYNLNLKRPTCIMEQPGLCMIPTIGSIPTSINFIYKEDESISRVADLMNDTLKKFGPMPANYFNGCLSRDDYGYQTNSPCIFLKINRSIGFVTKPYMNASELPQDAPDELYNYISKIPYQDMTSRIWLHCQISPKVKIRYIPNQYVETKHITLNKKRAKKKIAKSQSSYSFYDKRDYNRIIAVKFGPLREGAFYHVNCSMWAKNIVRLRDGRNSRGVVYGTIHIIDKDEPSGSSCLRSNPLHCSLLLTTVLLLLIMQPAKGRRRERLD